MAMELTIKNTFIDVEDSETPTAAKRSSSVPRSFKLATPANKLDKVASTGNFPCASDASTGDSDECLSDGDNEAIVSSSASDCTHMESDDVSSAGKKLISLDTLCLSDGGGGGATLSWSDLSEGLDDFTPKTVLKLSDVIVEEAKKERSRLSAKARLFEPVTSIPTDMQMVLMAGSTALSGCPKITNVHMTQGTFGGTTTIVGNYAKGSLQVFELVKTLATVKMALLDAASESTNTYIMGYLKTPFSNVGANGFSGKIGSVSAMQEDTNCWDSYQNGFCRRQSTCRWCHPTDHDLLKIVVMLNETHHIQHQ